MKLVPARSVRSIGVIGRPFMCIGMSRQVTFQRLLFLLVSGNITGLTSFLVSSLLMTPFKFIRGSEAFEYVPLGAVESTQADIGLPCFKFRVVISKSISSSVGVPSSEQSA